jgi:hypothetical protein
MTEQEKKNASLDTFLKDSESLDKAFTYHAPKLGQPERYQEIRAKAKEFARLLYVECPPSRERSLAITSLETAVMWANASIARNE